MEDVDPMADPDPRNNLIEGTHSTREYAVPTPGLSDGAPYVFVRMTRVIPPNDPVNPRGGTL